MNTTMQALRYNDSSAAPTLLVDWVPLPTPGPGELLVRVHAAGVTPTELRWYPTTHNLNGSTRTGAIPGHEFSGVIAAVGADVDPVRVGQEVFGMNDWFADGATTEYCLTTPAMVAPKPARCSHLEAASVPIGALTAWQGWFERARLQAGERVLIHGGAGAVGIFAVQLAKRAGAHVLTTASARNFSFLASLGADECIDYRTGRFEETVREVDVVFDGVGGETLRRSWGVLKPGSGRLVTIAADSEGTKDARIEKAFFIVEPKAPQLAEIARLLDAGELHCCVDAVVPFASAADAYLGAFAGRLGRGKMVLAVAG